MINVSRLWCGAEAEGDNLRYSPGVKGARNGVAAGRGPVVVWNCTQECNLHCRHCYSNSGGGGERRGRELNTVEARRLIEDLAGFRVPALLFSGGEPLMRPDLLELAAYAVELGIKPTISTNGTLIDPDTAGRLKEIGVGYVGVSLDGLEDTHDRFRGRRGAFAAALKGIDACTAVGQKAGLRFTLNRHNVNELGAVLDLVETRGISRVCFYHLVYSGRGSRMIDEDIGPEETRRAMDLIIDRTRDFYQRGLEKEILTVDNHADGIYLYLRLLAESPERAQTALKLLELNGGNRSGIAIASVDWEGNVYPDQFTREHILGNVRERSFREIWTDSSNDILAGLKDRAGRLKGRCRTCGWLPACNGNFRARAEAVTGDFWETDPACYLTKGEIDSAPYSKLGPGH